MSAEQHADQAQPQTATLPTRRRLWLLAGIAFVLSAILGWNLWQRWTAPVPPPIELSSAEPKVGELITKARSGVLQAPWSGPAWGQLAMALAANGYGAEAATCYAEAEKLDPRNAGWPYLHALILSTSDKDAALPLLRRAAELAEPAGQDASFPRLALAELLLERGQKEPARELTERVLKNDADDARAHFLLGVLDLQDDDLDGSLRHLTRSAESPHTRRRSYAQLAAVYRRLGDSRTAATFAERAQEVAPDSPWNDPYVALYGPVAQNTQSQLKRARSLEEAGRLQERATLLRELADELPDARAHDSLATTLMRLGDFTAAQQVLRTALERDPEKLGPHLLMSHLLFKQGEKLRQQKGQEEAARQNYEESARFAQQAAKIAPASARAYLSLGLALRRLGRAEDCITALRQAVERRPERFDAHLLLGEMLSENGRRAEALAELEQAAALNPNEPEIRRLIEKLRGKKGP